MTVLIWFLLSTTVSALMARHMRRKDGRELVHSVENVLWGIIPIFVVWLLLAVTARAGFGIFVGAALGWLLISDLYLRKSKRLASAAAEKDSSC